MKRTVLYILGAICILSGLALGVAGFYPTPEPEYGVSFSAKYARELGLDPHANLEALLEDMEFKHVRLMSYWDAHENPPGEYDFSDLDWQFELAEEYDAEVLLAIGQRQPRWPECHVPDWAGELDENEYRQHLLDYIETTVERYDDHPQLAGYHLENEAANRSFGHCPELDSQLLEREFALIDSLDGDDPITISVSNQYGIPIQPPIADRYAMSIYRQAYFELFDRQIYWNYSFVPAEWHRLRAWAIGLVHDRPTYIHELQTEPWGPVPTRELTLNEQDELMGVERISENLAYAESIGTESVYLWGGEWWYWRLSEHGDSTHWQGIKKALSNTR